MRLLHVNGRIHSDSELKKLLTDNFIVIFLDEEKIEDDILFKPLKYITIANINNEYFRFVFTDTNYDTDIYEIVDTIDSKEEFDLEHFGERHNIAIEIYYPLYFYAIYKGIEDEFRDMVTKFKQYSIQIESAKIVECIEKIIT